jgi:CubicO group peptidase (beta-lactamase class C family)
MADREHLIPYTIKTPGYLQSLSKPITAMGIMILKERGKLRYEQSIRQYLPDLSPCMEAVTIRNLLQHTGGLEGFYDFPDMTESDVFKIIQKQTVLKFAPGSKFEYSNAGYTLLGLIIQKVSGQTLNAFLTQNIFSRLRMNNTTVTDMQHRSKDRAIGYDLFGSKNDADSFEGGCASVISTVEDIEKFDESLYTDRLVSKQTMEEAFTPSIQQKDDIYGDRTYGFGWWISTHNGKRNIFHNGSSYGFKAYDEILFGDHINIVHISNLRHSVMFGMRTAIINILDGKPYSLPPRGIGPWIYTQTRTSSIDSAISLYNRITTSSYKDDFDFAESELNTLGYYLLRSNHEQDAIKIFKLNTIAYPGSFNVFDSLGEAYLKIGDKKRGLENYNRALELNPDNEDLKRRIADIK